MPTKSVAVTALALSTLLSGCASIFNSGNRNITINSVPPGAKATVTKAGSQEVVSVGTTPTTVSLQPRAGYFKGQSYLVKLELPGHQTSEITLKPTVTGWYFGNLLLGGLIGMLIVDPATGAMWNLSPDKIEQPLTKEQASVIASGDGFIVVMASQLTANERANMVRVQ